MHRLLVLLAAACAALVLAAPRALPAAAPGVWRAPPIDDDAPPTPPGDWFDGEIICGNREYHLRYFSAPQVFYMWVWQSASLVAQKTWPQAPNTSPLTMPQFNLYLVWLQNHLGAVGEPACAGGSGAMQQALFTSSYTEARAYLEDPSLVARSTYGIGAKTVSVLVEPNADGTGSRVLLEASAPGVYDVLDVTAGCDATCVDDFLGATLDPRLLDSIRASYLDYAQAHEDMVVAATTPP
ncbi:hypothetical protein L6R50_15940 [Myxococcota bacterium]|nr:hypothetical protein [Myxococcota bacterium]